MLWTFPSGAPIEQEPLVADQDIFVINTAGDLSSARPDDGQPRWTISTQGGRLVSDQRQARSISGRTTSTCSSSIARPGGCWSTPAQTHLRAGLNLREYDLNIVNRFNDRLYFATTSGLILASARSGCRSPGRSATRSAAVRLHPAGGAQGRRRRPAAAESQPATDAGGRAGREPRPMPTRRRARRRRTSPTPRRRPTKEPESSERIRPDSPGLAECLRQARPGRAGPGPGGRGGRPAGQRRHPDGAGRGRARGRPRSPTTPASPRSSAAGSRRSIPSSTAESSPAATSPGDLAALEAQGIDADRPGGREPLSVRGDDRPARRHVRRGGREHRHRRPEPDPGGGQEPRARRRPDRPRPVPGLDRRRSASTAGRPWRIAVGLAAGRLRADRRATTGPIADYLAGASRRRRPEPSAVSRHALDLGFDAPVRRSATARTPTSGPRSMSSRRRAARTWRRPTVLHGKELSYNNLLDLDSALRLIRQFAEPAAMHPQAQQPLRRRRRPTDLAEAFELAYEGDPVSAFGGIVGLNRPVDRATAERLCVARPVHRGDRRPRLRRRRPRAA